MSGRKPFSKSFIGGLKRIAGNFLSGVWEGMGSTYRFPKPKTKPKPRRRI